MREILVAASKQVGMAEARATRGDTATPVGPNPLRLGRADPGGPRHPMSDATPAPDARRRGRERRAEMVRHRASLGRGGLSARRRTRAPRSKPLLRRAGQRAREEGHAAGRADGGPGPGCAGEVDEVPVVSHPTAGSLDEAFEIALVIRRRSTTACTSRSPSGFRAVTADRKLYNATRGCPCPPGSLGR